MLFNYAHLEHGFGPFAYFVDGIFIGWAGIQPDEGDDFEIAIVLDPQHWGYGRQIYKDLIEQAFVDLNLDSITIYFLHHEIGLREYLERVLLKKGKYYLMVNGLFDIG